MTNDSDNDERSAQQIIEAVKVQMDDHLHSRRSVVAGGAALGLGAFGLSNTALAENDESSDDEMPDAPAEVTTNPSTDADVLNFALTLERLEARFYERGLDSLSDSTLRDSETLDGFGDRVLDDVVGQLETTKEHEQVHEDVLVQVIELLGQEPAPEPEFDFGGATDDPDEFLETAALLENTGVSAYNGAISLIQSPDLRTAGATIATVEGRHASYLNLLIGDDPYPNVFDEARSMSEVLDLAGPFIIDDMDDLHEGDTDNNDDDY